MFTPVQNAAYALIQSDARFLYSLMNINENSNQIDSNYILMSQPYIGLFAHGAEQWCRKLKLGAPKFNEKEEAYYSSLRQSHKLFENTFQDFSSLLIKEFRKSNEFFCSIRRLREMIFGYYNVGVDLCNNHYCGNTILCALYTPVDTLFNANTGQWLKDISIIAGKLASFFECDSFPPYAYNDKLPVKAKDYHFYKKCPLALKTDFGFALFSILCSVNFAIDFIDNFFIDEIPQKFKFAYLQYYYLCNFIKELNAANSTSFILNDSLKNREFRNCLAHYGLGQYLSESDLIIDDTLMGLTNKAFDLSYSDAKSLLYSYLTELATQIEAMIF